MVRYQIARELRSEPEGDQASAEAGAGLQGYDLGQGLASSS